MTPEPTTPQEWNQAALEALGWGFEQIYVLGMADVLVVPPNWPKDAWAYTGAVPDLASVDACLKHIVPVMGAKGYGINLDVTAPGLRSVARFYSWRNSYEAEEGMDLALAIVKAFVRAMRKDKE